MAGQVNRDAIAAPCKTDCQSTEPVRVGSQPGGQKLCRDLTQELTFAAAAIAGGNAPMRSLGIGVMLPESGHFNQVDYRQLRSTKSDAESILGAKST